MPDTITSHINSERARTGLFVVLLLIINIVMDGLPQIASPVRIQVLLLPLTVIFVGFCFYFLQRKALWTLSSSSSWLVGKLSSPMFMLGSICFLELCFVALFFYETNHFYALGYLLRKAPDALAFSLIILAFGAVLSFSAKLPSSLKLMVFLGAYGTGHILAILSFPLNYLRSDMLPVIFWADRALLARQNPYQHFHVADRIYDFPYLPGMLLAFAPAQILHFDLRWMAIAYVIAGMCLVYWATKAQFRPQAVLLIGLFVVSPYLQYRHELYTQGHFFSLILVFVLMQRRYFSWAAAVFGLSMVISQFSWVIFPFFLLNALRRGAWKEVLRVAAIASVTAMIMMAPFLASGTGTIAHNAVGQWDALVRPIARPINLSFWVSFLVRPIHLKWVQLAILSSMFGFCWLRGRCADLADTLRWMIAALIAFILLNVLVDGYFYLMLLVPMLVYTCVANGWWADPGSQPSKRKLEPAVRFQS